MPSHQPVKPFAVEAAKDLDRILDDMAALSFQGRQLGNAFHVWKEMLAGNVYILFGLAGAMVPAGMRKVIAFLIENHCIDCLVSTGANLFHDLHETLGRHHYMTSPNADDCRLRAEGLDRIYDTCAPEAEFIQTDRYIMDFALSLDDRVPITTAAFLKRLGERLDAEKADDGIITAAWRNQAPIFCPAIADSSYGIALSVLSEERGHHIVFDLVGDVTETAKLAEAYHTGVIYVGGGTPKNFIQQTEVTSLLLGGPGRGHEYAIQITADAPHWGGLSGCTFQEAQSWGKIAAEAKMATLHCDATIALPILVSGLAQHGIERERPTRIMQEST